MREEIRNLLTNVIINVPGADRDLAEMHLGNSLREFTRQSCVWTEMQDLVTVKGAAEYQLSAPCPYALVAWVLAAQPEGGYSGLSTMPAGQIAPTAYDAPGPPRAFTCPSPGIIRLSPVPDGTYRVQLLLALVATSLESPLPPNFVGLFHEALLSGALHRLYSMPGMPFSSLKLAEYHGKKFRAGMVDARIAGRSAYSAAFQPVWPNPLPAGRVTR
jgi:hypothetical protein